MTSTVETSYKKCFIHVKIELTIVLFYFGLLYECVPPTIFDQLYFLRLSKVWSFSYYTSVGRAQNKECYFTFSHTFLGYFFVFHHKICAFIIFI